MIRNSNFSRYSIKISKTIRKFWDFSNISFSLLVFLTINLTLSANEVRIGDLAKFQGNRENQITGFGLVVGLNQTGDRRSTFTEEALSNYLTQMGVDTKLRPKDTRNVASVMITANVPGWVQSGDRLDVTVSSIGDATSLEGGVLIQSPMKSANGEVVAVASGALQNPGDSGSKSSGKIYSKKKKSSNTSIIYKGAIIEKDLDSDSDGINKANRIRLVLESPNYSNINKMIEAILETYRDGSMEVLALNSREIQITLAKDKKLLKIIPEIENIKIAPETPARVVINEKTGTVVMGGNLVLDEVAVSKTGLKKGLTGKGRSRYFWSETEDTSESVFFVKKVGDVKSLVDELNRLGAGTEDVISILQSLKKSGILHAEVIVQ